MKTKKKVRTAGLRAWTSLPALVATKEQLLANIHREQVACKRAKSGLKSAWERAQLEFLPDDDAMRALGVGDHEVAAAGSFAVVARVDASREMLDEEKFFECVAKQFGVPTSFVAQLAEDCQTLSKRPLTKRVVRRAEED